MLCLCPLEMSVATSVVSACPDSINLPGHNAFGIALEVNAANLIVDELR